MEMLAFVGIFLTLLGELTVVGAQGGYECPRFIYKQDAYGFIYKLRTYIQCEHGCCGPHGDFCCTPSTEKPTPKDNGGLYLGVAAGTLVAVVVIISITCCCISKYNKKKVTVGVHPGSRLDQHRSHILTVQNLDERAMSPPPAYQPNAPTASTSIAPRDTSVRYTRSSGKPFTSTWNRMLTNKYNRTAFKISYSCFSRPYSNGLGILHICNIRITPN